MAAKIIKVREVQGFRTGEGIKISMLNIQLSIPKYKKSPFFNEGFYSAVGEEGSPSERLWSGREPSRGS